MLGRRVHECVREWGRKGEAGGVLRLPSSPALDFFIGEAVYNLNAQESPGSSARWGGGEEEDGGGGGGGWTHRRAERKMVQEEDNKEIC